MYVDEIKIFAKNENELDTLIDSENIHWNLS